MDFKGPPKFVNFKLHSTENPFISTLEKAWFSVSSTTGNTLISFAKLCWQAFPRYILKNYFMVCAGTAPWRIADQEYRATGITS